MQLTAVMTSDVVTIGPEETLERIRDIFEVSTFHHLVVMNRGRVEGVISDRDLLKHVSPFIGRTLMEREQDVNTLKKRAHQIMTRKPIVALNTMSASDAARLLLASRVSCLPVVDERQRLVGIVSWRDLLPHCFGDACGLDAPSPSSSAEAA